MLYHKTKRRSLKLVNFLFIVNNSLVIKRLIAKTLFDHYGKEKPGAKMNRNFWTIAKKKDF